MGRPRTTIKGYAGEIPKKIMDFGGRPGYAGDAKASEGMSALPPKADIIDPDWYVRFVPEADIGLMDCTVMKSEKANLDGLLLPPKPGHCGLR